MSDAKIDRRTAMIWAASLAATLGGGVGSFSLGAPRFGPVDPSKGYGLDPDINAGKTPWPNTLTADQLQAVIALCDFLLPAEGTAPSASQIGVQAMIDEWISAPYAEQQTDRALILEGLDWMNTEARKHGAAQFSSATVEAQHDILECLATPSVATDAPAGFYRKIRRLVIGGYYTTAEGFKDIGYIGNVPLAKYPEPSVEVQAALERAFNSLGLKA